MQIETIQKPYLLFVDDHALITKSYTDFFKLNADSEAQLLEACTIDDAYEFLFLNEPKLSIDLVVLDMSMPPSLKYHILNGLELGEAIRNRLPNTKIIVITNYDSVEQLKEIEEVLSPEGLLSKSDVDINFFMESCQKVLSGAVIKSDRVKKSTHVIFDDPISLDSIDISILHLISQGYDIKEKQEILQLTKSDLMLRKQKIKAFFGLETLNYAVLLQEAKKRNII